MASAVDQILEACFEKQQSCDSLINQ
jgi:hypothetical protein